MATPLPPHLFLRIDSPHDSAVRLFQKLPRDYHVVRRAHHHHVVSGTKLSFPDLISPSFGSCSFLSRSATDPDYEMEMVQTTVINLRTHTGQSAPLFEERAFRIKNGSWSLWKIDGHDKAVGHKVVDLVLDEIKLPERNGPSEHEMVQKLMLRGGPWMDSRGRNMTELTVWLGKEVCWLENHRLDQTGSGVGQFRSDEFIPEMESEEWRKIKESEVGVSQGNRVGEKEGAV